MTSTASPVRRLLLDNSTLLRLGSVLLPGATCAVLATTRTHDSAGVPAAIAVLVLVLWVVAAAATGDRVAGLLAAIASGVWFDLFLTAPYRTLAIKDSADVAVTVLLVVIGLAVTEIALWGRRQEAQAARRSGYLDGLLSTARLGADGQAPPEAVMEVAAAQIADVLDADDCRFDPGPATPRQVAILDHDGDVVRDDHRIDVDRVGLPTHDRVVIPVRRGNQVLGRFLVTSTSHVSYPSVEQRRVAVLLADQAAALVEDHPTADRPAGEVRR